MDFLVGQVLDVLTKETEQKVGEDKNERRISTMDHRTPFRTQGVSAFLSSSQDVVGIILCWRIALRLAFKPSSRQAVDM